MKSVALIKIKIINCKRIIIINLTTIITWEIIIKILIAAIIIGPSNSFPNNQLIVLDKLY